VSLNDGREQQINDDESSKSSSKRHLREAHKNLDITAAANHPQSGTCEKSMKTSIQLPTLAYFLFLNLAN
jgi:hypothetical protein